MREFSGLDIALLVVMIVTLVILIFGLGAMVKGGKFHAKYGNKLMQWRVIAQGVALAIFALILLGHR